MAYPIVPTDTRNVGLEPWREKPDTAPCAGILRQVVETARREALARECEPFDQTGYGLRFDPALSHVYEP